MGLSGPTLFVKRLMELGFWADVEAHHRELGAVFLERGCGPRAVACFLGWIGGFWGCDSLGGVCLGVFF